MNKLLFFIFLISFNFINSHEIRKLVYQNKICVGKPLVVYSSTFCSPAGGIHYYNQTMISVGSTNQELCSTITDSNEDTVNITTNQPKNYILNKCIPLADGNSNYYMVLENQNPVSVTEFCVSYMSFGSNCDTISVVSYENQTCIRSTLLNQYRLLTCNSTMTITYNCGNDSLCLPGNCTISTTDSGPIQSNMCNIQNISRNHIEDDTNDSLKLSFNLLIASLSILILITFYI